ncbi:hypothetical protein OG933_45505 (plasmid) [Streptomyces sp. NBC_00016]|uniref:hypothetical protein n=1 Tax=Streptomyces sp. NBC_00016 TaxID=2975622 RepID=UPI002F91BEB2
MVWNVEDLARDTVRRQGDGLTVAQVPEKTAEAARRERETLEQLATGPVDRDPYDVDPARLAEVWAARHAEWRRVAAWLDVSERAVYDPAMDSEGTISADDREKRRHGAAVRRAAWELERQGGRDELRAQVWLPADVSRRLRALAARAGLAPEQVLAQLADRVRIDDDGALSVKAFVP